MPKRFPLPERARATDNLAMPSSPTSLTSLSPKPFPRRAPLAHAIAALAVHIGPDAAGAPPSVVRMIPAGEFRAVDGRPLDLASWRIDAALAAPIVAASATRRSDYCIDYEHQTLLARENGKPAPAAGWYRDLEWRDDGLYATDVRWTPAAAQMIQAQEYRYISPVFAYDRETGAVRNLSCAALVSNPGLDGLTDLGASLERLAAQLFTPSENAAMNDDLLEQLQWLLNLPVGATFDEVIAQLQKLIAQIKSDVPAATGAARFDLAAHLQEQQTSVAVLAADLRKAPDATLYVPIAVHAELQHELAAARATIDDGQRSALMSAALADGRILPATETYWRGQPLAALTDFLDVAQPVAALSAMQTGGKSPSGSGDQATDPTVIARAAQQFQTAEEAAGRRVSIAAAVAHILHPR